MFKQFKEKFHRGLAGGNVGIPMVNYEKLGMCVSDLQKSRYWLLGGASSTGKTSLADELFVLDVFDWWVNAGRPDDVKISFIYNSMERNYIYKIAKWSALKLFKDTGQLVSTDSILCANLRFEPINEEIANELRIVRENKDLIDSYEEYFEELFDCLELHDEATGPTGIYKRVTKFAFAQGVKKEKKFGWDYVSTHPNHFVFIINDHVGKIKGEKNLVGDKAVLDKHSEYMGVFREKYLFIPVDIYQFNRGLTDSQRKANGDMYVTLDDFKGTSDGVENADHVIGIFNPYKYNMQNFIGYNTDDYISFDNKNRLRTVTLLKNSYGADDLDMGLGFLGEVGKFYELPSANDMTPEQQEHVNKILRLKKPSTGKKFINLAEFRA